MNKSFVEIRQQRRSFEEKLRKNLLLLEKLDLIEESEKILVKLSEILEKETQNHLIISVGEKAIVIDMFDGYHGRTGTIHSTRNHLFRLLFPDGTIRAYTYSQLLFKNPDLERLEVFVNGVQTVPGHLPQVIYTDLKSGTTFDVPEGQTLLEKLTSIRKKFQGMDASLKEWRLSRNGGFS